MNATKGILKISAQARDIGGNVVIWGNVRGSLRAGNVTVVPQYPVSGIEFRKR